MTYITVVYQTVASNGTCDSVRPVITFLGFVFQVGHLFILVFLLFLITARQFEMRLDNNCSLIIAKCGRKGLLDGRDSKMSGSITGNISFSLQVSVNKMCFPIIIPVKRKNIWPFESKSYFPHHVQQLCSTISPIYDFQWINSCTLSSTRLSAVLLLYVINSCHQCFFDCLQTCEYKITAGQ